MTDQREFYQLLNYTDVVDLNSKLEAWENFYNYDRPHMSHDGKTPYEVMKSLLEKWVFCPTGYDVAQIYICELLHKLLTSLI